MGTIIYIAGIVLAIMAVIDILKKNISAPWKIIWIVLVLVTSWIGIAVYYLFAKNRIEGWCK
ncbi:MAG: PLDc N-terminal domain-containing protein [Bacteroidales bacterium]|nr:PLDc N-terminal domain-containing protein [Bacteroidales bacterium]